MTTLNTHKEKAFENIVEKREMLVTSIFSFSNNVFYAMLRTLSVWKSLKSAVWDKGVKELNVNGTFFLVA